MEAFGVREDDLLMIRSNGSPQLVGRSALVGPAGAGMAFAGYLMRIRPDMSVISPDFLKLALNSKFVRRQVEVVCRSTNGINNINTAEARSLLIPLPPLPEQAEIMKAVTPRLSAAASISDRVAALAQDVAPVEKALTVATLTGSR